MQAQRQLQSPQPPLQLISVVRVVPLGLRPNNILWRCEKHSQGIQVPLMHLAAQHVCANGQWLQFNSCSGSSGTWPALLLLSGGMLVCAASTLTH
jgi:hypothetical protein